MLFLGQLFDVAKVTIIYIRRFNQTKYNKKLKKEI
jgi:hypothetical protein